MYVIHIAIVQERQAGHGIIHAANDAAGLLSNVFAQKVITAFFFVNMNPFVNREANVKEKSI